MTDVKQLVSIMGRDYNFRREDIMGQLQDKFEMSWNQGTRDRAVGNVQHYNVGNDLYTKMLDPTMNYACAYWKSDTKTLEEAQINKVDLVARKLKLKPGMRVLDIGCGWGM